MANQANSPDRTTRFTGDGDYTGQCNKDQKAGTCAGLGKAQDAF